MIGEVSAAPNGARPVLCQVAFSVVDLVAAERWFRDGLGFVPAGGARLALRGPLYSAGTGLPRAASTCWWLVGRGEFVQLELFQFERPLARLMDDEVRACDVGYRRIGVWVADFDEALSRLERLGSAPMGDVVGPLGERRACVRNPDGVYAEVMEDDPLSGAGLAGGRSSCPVALRSVSMSVKDLAGSEAFFSGLGLGHSDVSLRAPEHEAVWGLPGARSENRVFDGGSVLLEVGQYLDPMGRDRPADYRISDQGILNIAFGVRSRHENESILRRASEAGGSLNSKPTRLPGGGGAYVNDPQRFSVELMWLSPSAERWCGFVPRPGGRRPRADTHSAEVTVQIAAPIEVTWAVIADHDGMSAWSGASVRRIREGRTDPAGRGSERLLTLRGGAKVTEQVVVFERPSLYRYRVTKGGPFICHQGDIRLRTHGDQTELTWTIRFRPRLPGTGRLLSRMLSRQLERSLNRGLRRYVEALERARRLDLGAR